MSVKTVNMQYSAMLSEWAKCLDFMNSAKSVKDKGTTYLPQLSEQEPDEYTAYKYRAPVIMYSQRSQRAMSGMITRKEAYITGSKGYEFLLDSADSRGRDINAYNALLLKRFMTTGRCATLVDMPTVMGTITVAQAEIAGIRPRFVFYNDEDILNWRIEKVNNIEQLVHVVLRETINEVIDEFNWTEKYQYRVLSLINGVYIQRVYNESEALISETAPQMNRQFMKYIPIAIHGGVEIQDPPLNATVDINLAHYQLGADEIYGLRMAALPTPYFFGEDPEDDKFPSFVGPGRVIGSDDVNAKTGFREFSGAGMASVAKKLLQFEDIIAKLAVQMTSESINKSATGAGIDYANSTSSLTGIASMLSTELTWVYKVMVEWAGGVPEDAAIRLNQDFIPKTMDPQFFGQLLQAYLKGTITYDTYYKNLAVGEVTDPHKESEDELTEIGNALPPGLEFGEDEDDEGDEGDDNSGGSDGDES